jgi:hypothetical protein
MLNFKKIFYLFFSCLFVFQNFLFCFPRKKRKNQEKFEKQNNASGQNVVEEISLKSDFRCQFYDKINKSECVPSLENKDSDLEYKQLYSFDTIRDLYYNMKQLTTASKIKETRLNKQQERIDNL